MLKILWAWIVYLSGQIKHLITFWGNLGLPNPWVKVGLSAATWDNHMPWLDPLVVKIDLFSVYFQKICRELLFFSNLEIGC